MDPLGAGGHGAAQGLHAGVGNVPRLLDAFRRAQPRDFGRLAGKGPAPRAQIGHGTAPSPAVLSDGAHGIAVADRNRRILKVSAAFSRITGYDSADAVGRELDATLAGDLASGPNESIWESVTQEGRWQGEISGRRRDGTDYAALLTIDAVEGDAELGLSYVVSIFDCAPIQDALGHLHFLAHHDSLTGLANRLLFWTRLEQSIERARRHRRMAAVLYIDLDGFKAINDRLGHAAGDQLLRCVAARLRGQLRGEDTIARLGGDEFGAIIEGLSSREDVRALARKLSTAISALQHIEGIPIRARVSIGCGFCPDDGETPEDLLKAADAAMYRAKRARRRGPYGVTPRPRS